MSKILPWPDLTGARDYQGRLCVGLSTRRSLAKNCQSYFRFYDPERRMETESLATNVTWRTSDPLTSAVLLHGIHELLVKKGVTPFDRGSYSGRLIGDRFLLMETQRGMVWPRYKWWLPHHLPWASALRSIIWQETLFPDVVVGEPDNRGPTSEIAVDYDENCPVRANSDLRQFVTDLLVARASTTEVA